MLISLETLADAFENSKALRLQNGDKLYLTFNFHDNHNIRGVVVDECGRFEFSGVWDIRTGVFKYKDGRATSMDWVDSRRYAIVGLWQESTQPGIDLQGYVNPQVTLLKTRDGSQVQILSAQPNGEYLGMLTVSIGKTFAASWGRTGAFLNGTDESPYDIVGLWEE